MQASEKKCKRHGFTSTYLWSKLLMLAGQKVTYWKDRKKSLNLGIFLATLSGYAMHLYETFEYTTLHLSEEQTKLELKKAWKELREVQKEDRSHQKQFLLELAQARAKQQNISAESVIKQINYAEESRESHSKFNYHLKSTNKGAISHVMIPIGDDPKGVLEKKWRKVTDEGKVEYFC